MKIILTGGGTAGHITPNLALVPGLRAAGFEVEYIGEKGGMEERLVKEAGIPFFGISAGKLRRDKNINSMGKNAADMFRTLRGINEAKKLLRKQKPDLIFSKGGFVTVPVVFAARACKVPVIAHESDYTPGLANQISLPYVGIVCTAFPETLSMFSEGQAVYTGTPVRESLFSGEREKGLAMCGFSGKKPVLLVMGGSQGSVKINECVRKTLPALLPDFDVVHLCGAGNLAPELTGKEGYKQFEFVSAELPDIFAASDMAISRAGANAIFEFLALGLPHLLIPLAGKASRGDQVVNAESFRNQGFSMVLEEANMTGETLEANIRELWRDKEKYIANMRSSDASQGLSRVLDTIIKFSEDMMS
ncbi:MAG: undecaprenyldiphospho-muramoylpentapeptide beta-N-acetylglucosaminyltransferase [Firmicutes bacterium]|nr:undecaprenyldiphospho-muramoylpentapeptide beta-N-acetylglucosaminyltransferase [Bacillota bacterium]